MIKTKKLKTYSVFGFYSDNDQRAGFQVQAASPDQAEKTAIRQGAKNEGEFVPVVVLEGDHRAVDTKEYIKGGI